MKAVVLVSTSHFETSLTRIESGGECFRATHRYSFPARANVSERLCEEFRLMPDPEYSLDPPPRPTNPPQGAGTATLQQAA